jgi:transcription initiation factor TFIID subunit 2
LVKRLRAAGAMPGYFDNALPTEQSLDLGFSVVSQKVDLTVDFARQAISGSTEITVQPEIKDLKTIRLNCRQARILSANIEGSKAEVSYSDPYQKIKLSGRTTAHQHEYLRTRIEGAIKQSPDPELALEIPLRVKIKELNTESSSTLAKSSLTRQESEFPAQAETPNASNAQEPTLRYAPLKVTIEFEVTSFRDGLHFVGFSDQDSRYPHLYTRNTLGPGAICSVFPCVDDATTRCMWELSIRCHKTLGDAFRKTPQRSPAEGDVDMTGTDQKDKKPRDEYLINLSEEEKSLDLSIVCSGEMTDDVCSLKHITIVLYLTDFRFLTRRILLGGPSLLPVLLLLPLVISALPSVLLSTLTLLISEKLTRMTSLAKTPSKSTASACQAEQKSYETLVCQWQRYVLLYL